MQLVFSVHLCFVCCCCALVDTIFRKMVFQKTCSNTFEVLCDLYKFPRKSTVRNQSISEEADEYDTADGKTE